MTGIADRFRHWYAFEQDCNGKALDMLASVPVERRSEPAFQRAVDLMAHLFVARRIWLHRLAGWPEDPGGWSPGDNRMEDLPEMRATTEAAWVAYLANLDDASLEREFEWQAKDGNRYRWRVEPCLTQVHGHAFYHRGQVAMIVDDLGGTTSNTDYYFFDPPERSG